ncbi:endo-1,4-beta-xylanase [Chthoniobacter flavus]|nr:endo-1,4-beta-xylanase [Chthoniobacter flavus]
MKTSCFLVTFCSLSAAMLYAADISSPWGVATSASGMGSAGEWMPRLHEIGIGTGRAFPEWPSIEPRQGEWHWDRADALVHAATANHFEVTAVMMGKVPWSSEKGHTFPMSDLAGWSEFFGQCVARYKDRIHYWEVWNEGNGGFNDGHHTAADYGRLAAAAYAAAKKADPTTQVGLTTASFDPAYLEHAILAQKEAGTPGQFDYLCIHPYELADGIGRPNGEIPYLWMTHLLRDELKESAPDKANADIWITEIGRNVAHRKDQSVAEHEAATTLVKLYVMALAQGIHHVQWFEAQDPVGEEPGFGLLKRDGTTRATYQAYQTMIATLGPKPKYLGWVALGEDGRGYGFVFQGRETPVLVAWKAAGDPDQQLTFPANVQVRALSDYASKALEGGDAITLGDEPVFVSNYPASLTGPAEASREEPFPWGGDFSKAHTVSVDLGAAVPSAGVFQAGPQTNAIQTFADGTRGLLVGANQGMRFHVHPSFASIHQREYYVRVTVRRVAPGNVGMNLHYEVADSHGGSPYHNVGTWFSVKDSEGWQTFTWHVKDACFAKMWGYDIALVPEQSQPFVLGKVEVSTELLR